MMSNPSWAPKERFEKSRYILNFTVPIIQPTAVYEPVGQDFITCGRLSHPKSVHCQPIAFLPRHTQFMQNFHSVCAFCLKTSLKSKNPNFLLFLLFCCHPFAFLFQLCPLLFVVCHWSRREGGYIFDHKWPAAPFIQSIERTALFQSSSEGLWGCFFRLIVTNTHVNLEKQYSLFSGFSWLQIARRNCSPKAPKVFKLGAQRKPGSRRLVLNPVSVIQISKTFHQHNARTANNTDLQNNNPQPLQGGQQQQHFIDQFLIEPTYLSRDGSST